LQFDGPTIAGFRLGGACLVTGSLQRVATGAIGAALIALLAAAMTRVHLAPRAASGPYSVGLTTLQLDHVPVSTFSVTRPAPLVQLWYPAEPHAPSTGATGLTRWLHALDYSPPPVSSEAALTSRQATFPVILYFSGWPGTDIQNRILINELVSHGFILATLTYPARLSGMTDEAFRQQVAQLQTPMDFSSAAGLQTTNEIFDQRIHDRGLDTVDVLDELRSANAPDSHSRFRGRFDMDHVGVLGFSLGGSIASHACWVDPRLVSAVSLDGTHWVDSPIGEKYCRFLFMGEPLSSPSPAELAAMKPWIRKNALKDNQDFARIDQTLKAFSGMEVIVARTTHLDFTDAALQSPLGRYVRRLIDGREMVEIVNRYVLAFFEQTLMQRREGLLDGTSSPYPDVKLRIPAQALRTGTGR
jgi:dienelactone hydrolase